MTKLRALPERSAGSTVAAIHIDYARDSLEDLTAPVQRSQHYITDNAPALLAGGDAARALRARTQGAHLDPDPESGGPQQLAAA